MYFQLKKRVDNLINIWKKNSPVLILHLVSMEKIIR